MWAPRRFIRLEGLRFRVGRSDLVESKSGSSFTLVLLLLGGCCRVGSFDLVAVGAVLSAVAGWGCYRVGRNELVAAAVIWAAIG